MNILSFLPPIPRPFWALFPLSLLFYRLRHCCQKKKNSSPAWKFAFVKTKNSSTFYTEIESKSLFLDVGRIEQKKENGNSCIEVYNLFKLNTWEMKTCNAMIPIFPHKDKNMACRNFFLFYFHRSLFFPYPGKKKLFQFVCSSFCVLLRWKALVNKVYYTIHDFLVEKSFYGKILFYKFWASCARRESFVTLSREIYLQRVKLFRILFCFLIFLDKKNIVQFWKRKLPKSWIKLESNFS